MPVHGGDLAILWLLRGHGARDAHGFAIARSGPLEWAQAVATLP